MSDGAHGKGFSLGRILRASAIRVRLDRRKAARKDAARKQAWQDEAWDYFDEVPEVKALTWFLGNAMSKLRIFVAVRPDDDPNATPIPASDPESGIPLSLALAAQAELNRLKGPLGGRSEIQREANMNFEVAGECYLVGWGPHDEVDEDTHEVVTIEEAWEIRSTREVTVEQNGEYRVKDDPRSGDKGKLVNPETDAIIRMYQRHPGASALADCHMRGVLNECELVTLLTNELKAESKSRQSAGFLTIPNELSYGAPTTTDIAEGDEDAEENQTDPFEEALMNAIVAPIEDPAAPESVYPLIMRGPGEWLHPDYLRHFSMARDTTALIEERIEKRVERIARGLNAPVEATMGHQNTTFANAFQVDEDTYEDHLQPRALLLADALTVGYMIPNLLALMPNMADLIGRLIVWFDPSDIIKRTDPVEAANDALAAEAISWEAYRQYKGFTEDDAPDPTEQLFRLVLKMSRPDPNMVDAIVQEIDPTIDVGVPVQVETAGEGGSMAAQRARALRTLSQALATDKAAVTTVAKRLANDPGRKLYEIDRDLRTRVRTAANAALNRALERAGTKLKVQRDAPWRAALKSVNPVYAASVLGRDTVLAAGFHDEDLIGDEAWSALEQQYRVWGAQAQRAAIDVVNDIIGLSTHDRSALQLRQAASLDESWSWMSDHLHELAVQRLYQPDVVGAVVGEFDPTVRVPTGLVREALSRAGGAQIEAQGTNPFVVVGDGGNPVGGIGTGQLVMDTLAGADVMIEAYQWDYGPAFRQTPFDEHLDLDGAIFTQFDSDVLAAGDWIGDFYFPGDHDGCCCDFIPTFALPEDIEEG